MTSRVLLDSRTGRPIVDRGVRAALDRRGWRSVVENLERSRRPVFGLERNPPLFMDVSSAYSGDELGLPYRDIMGEGILASTDLAVTAQAGANSVNVAKGACWVVGDTNADLQPTYRMFNDAIVNLGISPDPALARRVHVISQVTDQGFAGTGRVWALQALHGTPNAAPVLPALPASAISLADILVPAAAASSAAYTITDLRTRARIGDGGAAFGGPGAYGYRTADLSIANNTVTPIPLTVETFDDEGIHDTAANQANFVIAKAGRYLIVADVYWQAGGTGIRELGIRIGGGLAAIVDTAPLAANDFGQHVSTILTTTGGGVVIDAYVYQNSGGAIAIRGTYTHVAVYRIGR